MYGYVHVVVVYIGMSKKETKKGKNLAGTKEGSNGIQPFQVYELRYESWECACRGIW